ncbi:MAG: 50S ribosomal protein L22 [Patescibacteria group bacterium]|nr:50S ribosomal protein L22 [Patescibacteria group bacterium]
MQVRARLKNFRMSAKKARLVADLVRGENFIDARAQLQHLKGKMAEPLLGLIDSCAANGLHNFGLEKTNLYIDKIEVGEGTVMKRWRPRAHGRAYPIFKRACHIEVILDEIEAGKGRVKVKKQKAKTLTYKELQKITSQADKMLSKQQEKKQKEKKQEQGKQQASKGKGSGAERAISKIFRRKSI